LQSGSFTQQKILEREVVLIALRISIPGIKPLDHDLIALPEEVVVGVLGVGPVLRRAKDERRQWIGQQVLDVDLSLLRRAVDEKRADVLRAVQVERSFVLSGFTFSRIAVAEHSDEKTVCHLQAPLD
jgi:hypothetical protein